MLKIGSLVDGKYKILSKVGQGGMSVVYMAINEKANKTWAVKEVRKDGVLDFEAVKQGLVAETDILKKLSHPNLPSIIDVIDTDDSFIIIMDYIQGNSLNKALEEYGAQPQDRVIEWAKQLCDVLGYLHSRQPPIIYRDMKPANIMLKPDGNVTLIDFGTAREFKEKNLADTTCLGTVGYAAPEQFKLTHELIFIVSEQRFTTLLPDVIPASRRMKWSLFVRKILRYQVDLSVSFLNVRRKIRTIVISQRLN